LSDERLKLNITKLTISEEMKLPRAYYYELKNEVSHTATPIRKRIGFLAQEVESIIPQAVEQAFAGSSNGMKYVSYDSTIAYLVEAWKKLHEKRLSLQSRLESMNVEAC
jgi:hypothetical protein